MKKICLILFVSLLFHSLAAAQDDKPNAMDYKLLAIKGIQIGPGYALMDALDHGNRTNLPPGTNPYSDYRHTIVTLATVGEVDVCFDLNNGVGFRYAYFAESTPRFWASYSAVGASGQSSVYWNGANLFSLVYYRYLPDRLGRWYGTASLDYYTDVSVSFDYYNNNGGPVTIDQYAYNLGGEGPGASLGFGRELALANFLALDFSVQFRYAKIPKVVGPAQTGHTQTLATTSNGGLALVDTAFIGQGGLQYAPIDLSGLYGLFSINLYPF